MKIIAMIPARYSASRFPELKNQGSRLCSHITITRHEFKFKKSNNFKYKNNE